MLAAIAFIRRNVCCAKLLVLFVQQFISTFTHLIFQFAVLRRCLQFHARKRAGIMANWSS
jgi:hypothetical protein